MFRKKGIVILYKDKEGSGICWSSPSWITRFVSYPTLFDVAYEKLKEERIWGFTVTNVIKL